VAWFHARQRQREIDDAQATSEQKSGNLIERRAALAASLESTKGGISELAHHTKSAKEQTAAAAPPAPAAAPARVQHNHEDAAALLNQTKQIAADQKVLTLLDRRIADQKQLASIYGQWSAAITAQSRALAHTLLLNALVVIVVLIALLLIDGWLEHLLDTQKLDRRQIETLRTMTRVTLRVVAAIVILLILIGIPTQFGTMIGIVGAGLTVAL
jgi:hypothetical protein